NVVKAPVTSNQNQFMTSCRGCNPNVVLRQRLPFSRRRSLSRPYSRATSKSHETMDLPDANRSTLAVFSEGRPDFAAPKNNSPSTIAEINTPVAPSRLNNPVSSPASTAMTMLVSSRYLPLASIHVLAILLDRSDHLPGRSGIERAREAAESYSALAL